MSIIRERTIAPINLELFEDEARIAFGSDFLFANIIYKDTPGAGVRLVFDDNAIISEAAIDGLIAAHNPAAQTTEQQTNAANAASEADARARWLAHALKGKTPTEIYTLVQSQIDGWTTLADARADLRDWIPLIASAVAWTAMKQTHTE